MFYLILGVIYQSFRRLLEQRQREGTYTRVTGLSFRSFSGHLLMYRVIFCYEMCCNMLFSKSMSFLVSSQKWEVNTNVCDRTRLVTDAHPSHLTGTESQTIILLSTNHRMTTSVGNSWTTGISTAEGLLIVHFHGYGLCWRKTHYFSTSPAYILSCCYVPPRLSRRYASVREKVQCLPHSWDRFDDV